MPEWGFRVVGARIESRPDSFERRRLVGRRRPGSFEWRRLVGRRRRGISGISPRL